MFSSGALGVTLIVLILVVGVGPAPGAVVPFPGLFVVVGSSGFAVVVVVVEPGLIVVVDVIFPPGVLAVQT